MTRSAKLREVYARLPTVECKGLCSDECTHVQWYPIERRLAFDKGLDLPVLQPVNGGPDLRCSALLDTGRCAIYKDRPWICRAYGVLERLQCPHGCEATPRPLTDDEAVRFAGWLHELDPPGDLVWYDNVLGDVPDEHMESAVKTAHLMIRSFERSCDG